MQRASLLGGLAAVALASGVVGTASVQAATPASTFVVPPAAAGGPVHLTKTKHYSDGSTTYTFEGDIAGHKNSAIVYLVNADNPGQSAAQEVSIAFKSGYNKPLFKGRVKLVQGHDIWIVRERGGTMCRDSMGTFWHKSAYAVTLLSANTTNCAWMDDATVKASTAIYKLLP